MKSYKEKYESALSLMRDCIPDENGLVHVRPSDIFAELMDEDERIRKALIKYHQGTVDLYGIEGKHILSWLEKQQNQQMPKINGIPKSFRNKLGELMQYTPDELEKEEGLELLNQAAEELLQLAYSKEANNACNPVVAEAEKKSRWTEGDAFYTNALISLVKDGGTIRMELRNEFVDWLKSLKLRISV